METKGKVRSFADIFGEDDAPSPKQQAGVTEIEITKLVPFENHPFKLYMHIMGPRATDIISEMCVAMKLESTIEEVASTIHPHPTVSEIVMEAALDVEGICVHKPKK